MYSPRAEGVVSPRQLQFDGSAPPGTATPQIQQAQHDSMVAALNASYGGVQIGSPSSMVGKTSNGNLPKDFYILNPASP